MEEKKSDSKDILAISTFDELTAKKAELDKEVNDVGSRVSSAGSDLLKQGAKVAAVGVAAVVISKAVGEFIKSRRDQDEDVVSSQSEEEIQSTSAEAEIPLDDEVVDQEPMADRVRSLLMWLDALIKGIETAKVLIDEFRQDKASDEGAEGSQEVVDESE